MVMNEYIVG